MLIPTWSGQLIVVLAVDLLTCTDSPSPLSIHLHRFQLMQTDCFYSMQTDCFYSIQNDFFHFIKTDCFHLRRTDRLIALHLD